MFFLAKEGWWNWQMRIVVACFASPFGACVTVHLFLKTCAVQTVRAEELWARCKKVKQETRQVSGFKKTGGCYFKA